MVSQRWENLKRGRGQGSIFHKFYSYQIVSSTNEVARRLLQKDVVNDYFVVYSKIQTQGKGRWGREWWSPEGGLWCSLVTPKISIPSLRAAFTIVQVIKRLTPLRPGIRWPNDIIIRDKKVGGVLTENEGEKLIIGIGVNINQESFPPHLSEATSLKMELGKTFSIHEFLRELVDEFSRHYHELTLDTQVIDQIKEVIVLLGKNITAKVKEGIKTGILWDIATDGSLLLREASGIITKLTPLEVEFIR